MFCELDIEDRKEIISDYNVSKELEEYLIHYLVEISDMDFFECYNKEVLDVGEATLAPFLLRRKPYIVLSRIDTYLINNQPEYLLSCYEFENDEIDKYFENCPYGRIYKRDERIKNILE